jgi:hypothetical protein
MARRVQFLVNEASPPTINDFQRRRSSPESQLISTTPIIIPEIDPKATALRSRSLVCVSAWRIVKNQLIARGCSFFNIFGIRNTFAFSLLLSPESGLLDKLCAT